MANSNIHNRNTNNKIGWDIKAEKEVAPNNMKGRVNFDPIAFDKLILQQGTRVKVYRTMYCGNVKSVDGAEHEIDCTIPGCNGSGFIDRHPIETMAFIQNQALEKNQFAEGMVDGNTVAATFLVGISLQYFTLVELCDFTDIFFQRVSRSDTSVDVLKYNAMRVNMIVDANSIEYHQCIDYKIDINGNIEWFAGKGPAANVIYSIHYEAPVQFRATQAMHANRFSQVKTKTGISFVKFQEQWALAKSFLVKRLDKDGNEMQPKKYNS